MLETPLNTRAFSISHHELEQYTGHNPTKFLWYCYQNFKDLVRPKSNNDLVFLWQEDFDDLWNNYKKNKYHTITELYNHRHVLFYALTKIYDNYITPLNTRVKCYKSKLHHDGTMFEDSFIVIMMISKFDGTKSQISYHLPLSWWDKFKLMEIPNAPPYDGHNSDDILERLLSL